MKLTDEALREASRLARERLLFALPEPEACQPEFSQRFIKRMDALCRRQRRGVQVLRRVAAAILAALLGAGAWLAADSDARAAILQWIKEVYESSAVYRFFGRDATDAEVSWTPTWLPAGYAEVSATVLQDCAVYLYQNEAGDQISLHCVPMQQGAAVGVALETAEAEPVVVNGCEGTLYLETDHGKNSVLVWLDAERSTAFTLSANLSKMDILHMAESVKLSLSTN